MALFDEAAARDEFEQRRQQFFDLKDEAYFILDQQLRSTNIKVHSLTSRVKTVDSFIEKSVRKDLEDPFRDIEDVVGLRVVLLFLSDMPDTLKLIRQSFTVRSEENKVESSDVSNFEYMSIHFNVEIQESYRGPRYDTIKGMPFEIQVRTILMDAWANVSHYLDYKGQSSIPSELRRDFYALSGLFYVADRHFELFFERTLHSREKAEKSIDTEQPDLEQELNLDTMLAYLQRKFPDRKHVKGEDVADLVNELTEAGYTTLTEIDRKVSRGLPSFEEFERNSEKGTIFHSDLGTMRGALTLADRRYLEFARKKWGRHDDPWNEWIDRHGPV
jgi:putative GTP pyrophosphokinase